MQPPICSRDNATFKKLRSLLTRKGRRQTGSFLLEGARYIETAIRRGIFPAMLVCSEASCRRLLESGRSVLTEPVPCVCRTVVLSDPLFGELSDTEHSQGLLAVYPIPDGTGAGVCSECASGGRAGCGGQPSSNTVILDAVQDPGNVGTILRTADAAGIRELFLVEGSADPYAPKTVRATAGSILNVGVRMGRREEILATIRAAGYRIVASTLENAADYRSYFRSHGPGGPPVALVLGSEAHGVSDAVLQASDARVHIPIYGGAESLNVAAAAALLIYQMQER